MKIEKGHYVPKELITSEAVHGAVVKVFVAAGFRDRRPEFGKLENYTDGDSGLGIWNGSGFGESTIMWGVKGDSVDESLTLQQLFTAENGLQWPSFATEIRTDDNAVWFFGGGQAEHICGSIQPIPHRVLATRQPKEKEVKTIEDAVIYHNGVWPVEDGGFLVYHKKEDEYSVSYDACIHTHAEQIVCNEQEFESCAKRLGYINGYRWGLEYPTNGDKPNLGSDVWLSVKEINTTDFDHPRQVLFVKWHAVQSFMITDQRYKPIDTSYLNASTQTQSLTHSEEGLTHSDSVKNPKHYQVIEGVESITIIASAMTVEQWHGFCLGNILKYRIRAGKKGDLQQDIAKADYYQELYEMHKHLCRDAS